MEAQSPVLDSGLIKSSDGLGYLDPGTVIQTRPFTH